MWKDPIYINPTRTESSELTPPVDSLLHVTRTLLRGCLDFFVNDLTLITVNWVISAYAFRRGPSIRANIQNLEEKLWRKAADVNKLSPSSVLFLSVSLLCRAKKRKKQKKKRHLSDCRESESQAETCIIDSPISGISHPPNCGLPALSSSPGIT